MALTFTTGMTNFASGDSTTGYSAVRWNGSGSAPAIAAADDFVEGTGAIQSKLAGNNWDAAVLFDYYTQNSNTVLDLTASGNEIICGWFKYGLISQALTVASGGCFLVVSSSTETGTSTPTAYSQWYIGGSDYYPTANNGWVFFMIDTGTTPSLNTGGGATLSSVRRIGVGVENVSSVGTVKGEPFYLDAMWYGRPTYTVVGDGTTTATWEDFRADSEDTNQNGLIQDVGGAFQLRCGIQFGTTSQSSTTTFDDSTNQNIIFKRVLYHTGSAFADAMVYSEDYTIEAFGNGASTTSVTLGDAVGSGDDRQGLLGGNILVEDTANMEFSADFQTDIADLAKVNLYGVTFQGAKGGMLFDGKATTADSSLISCNFVNCGAVDTGAASNGVEMLSCSFIDPDGTTNNYGLEFGGTPSASVLTTNVKKINFITSGSPTTQYMTYFPESSDYTVSFSDMQFFGDYSSGTLWHGLNDGTDADVTINASGSTNAVQAEFTSSDVTGPDTGSVTVNVSVDVNITIVDQDGNGINLVQTAVFLSSDGTQVLNTDTNGSGLASGTYSGTTPADVYIRWRKSSSGTTRYFADSSTGTIASGTGLTAQFVMKTDTIASS